MAQGPESQLFVIVASGSRPRANVKRSIALSVPDDLCEAYLSTQFLDYLRQESNDGRIYAWGTKRTNKAPWDRLRSDDPVLVYQNGVYTYFTRILSWAHDPSFAKALWENDVDDNGNTILFEYVFFLDQPMEMQVPAEALDGYVPRQQGFSRISPEKVSQIEDDFGSLDAFLQERVFDVHGSPSTTYLLLRSNADSPYDDEEGQVYEFSSHVPNYRKVKEGAQFLVDRRTSAGKQLIGRGEIDEVREFGTDQPRQYKAIFRNYVPLDPPIPLGEREEALLERMPNYNYQHAIRVLDREIFEHLLNSHEVETPTLEDIAKHTYLDKAELQEILELLDEKQQVIFEGPPGSGKTFVAEVIARYLAEEPLQERAPAHVTTVQFHPSYSYEDFVEGLRPEPGENHVVFRPQPGVLKRACWEASESVSDQRHVLVIDEINRADLSRVFGELLYLLEYRNRYVQLPYSEEEFTIPENLYFIGTMNSADRSLAVVDYALRRRFYFYRFMPVEHGDAPVLREWLRHDTHLPETRQEQILGLFVELNRRVQEHLGPDFQIGHSYFMNEAKLATDEGLKRLWRWAIDPLLREYFFHERDIEDRLAEFDLETLLEASSLR